jgi:hypothetical protein
MARVYGRTRRLDARDGVTHRFTQVHVSSMEDCYALIEFTVIAQSTYYNDVCLFCMHTLKGSASNAYKGVRT